MKDISVESGGFRWLLCDFDKTGNDESEGKETAHE